MKKVTISKAKKNKPFYFTTRNGRVVRMENCIYNKKARVYNCIDRCGELWILRGDIVVEQ